ncbi:hypothetical protein [Streptomyces sp. NPDC060243]|uniref:hypothetical protein n=1 Tax=Streptomyces sp. NPDC060243 TaxID=3347081 RepID=UPI00365A7006
MLRRLDKRLGRRGSYLACAGSAWTLYGAGVIIEPRPGTVRSMVILREIAPMWVWGLIWVVCGLTAVAFGLARTGKDRWGFGAAVLPTLMWAGAYGLAIVAGDFPAAWTGAATWLFAALRLIVVSGWPETTPTTTRRQDATI